MTPEDIQILVDSIRVAAETSTRLQNEYTIQVLTVTLAALTTLGMGVIGYFQHRLSTRQKESHNQFNSRMDELKEAWKDAAFKAGQKQEKDDQIARDA